MLDQVGLVWTEGPLTGLDSITYTATDESCRVAGDWGGLRFMTRSRPFGGAF